MIKSILISEKEKRNLWVDYLRSAITVLVVAHHSSLAYTTFAHFDKEIYIKSTHPVVDSKRWVGLDIFENFNDVFFMFLMFFIGGLFLLKSINKKGPYTFIKDRFYRLLLPFIFGGTLLMLIAYFPPFYIARNSTNVIAYVKDFFTTEGWPVGPPWFIWMLFAFNLLLVPLNFFFKKLFQMAGNQFGLFQNNPFSFFLFMCTITWLLYVPIAYKFGADTWSGTGPFDFQVSRIIVYFGYFVTGAIIGNTDFNNGIFSERSPLVRKWKLWIVLSLIIYTTLTLNNQLHVLRRLVDTNMLAERSAWLIYYTLYVFSCTINCIAFLTTFRHLVHSQKAWWISLSENAYLIYLIHYVFVVWIQFSLLNTNISAFLKFVITFIFSLALSWGASILLRKNKIIATYL